MPRKKETLTLSVPGGTKKKLEQIAERLGILWGNKPSASGLVSAIANQSVEVGQLFTLSPAQVKHLRQAIHDLTDAGHVEEAKSVIALLLDRGQLEAPLRQDLIKKISSTRSNFRQEVDQYIAQQQPFLVFYTNSQEQTLEFTVRHAEVEFQEKRFYLQVWCDEEETSTDLPELRHNRCLRFDRIQEILPTGGPWRGRFDEIRVELHFYGGLVEAYESKPTDEENTCIDDENVRKVIRRVVNPFWLVREVMPYGENCEIVSPPAMRDRLKQEIEKMGKRYGLFLQ